MVTEVARMALSPHGPQPRPSWGGGIPHARACLARVMCVHKLPWSVPGRARVCPLAPISYTYLLTKQIILFSPPLFSARPSRHGLGKLYKKLSRLGPKSVA